MRDDWCIWTPYIGCEVYVRTTTAEQLAARVESVEFNPLGQGVALLADTIEIVVEESPSGPDDEARDAGAGHMPDSQVAYVSLATARWGDDWTLAKWRKAAGPQAGRDE